MPPRICVLGNSHVACLKLAHDQDPRRLAASGIDFFAGSANSIDKLQLLDGHRLATRDAALTTQLRAVSRGKDSLDLRDYDAFLLVGISFEYRDFFRLFRRHCLYRHLKWRAGRDLVSDGYFTDFMAGLYAERAGNRFARQIAAVSVAPVIIVPSPYPSETVLNDKAARPLKDLRDTAYFAELAAFYATSATAAATALGAGIALQDPRTLAAPGFTDRRFNQQSVGLAPVRTADGSTWHSRKSAQDAWHMNPDFGRHRLEDIAAALAAAAPADRSGAA